MGVKGSHSKNLNSSILRSPADESGSSRGESSEKLGPVERAAGAGWPSPKVFAAS